MEAQKSYFWRLPQHIESIIFKIPLLESCISMVGTTPYNFLDVPFQKRYSIVLKTIKTASVTSILGLFLDSKLFLKITKKFEKLYNSNEYLL